MVAYYAQRAGWVHADRAIGGYMGIVARICRDLFINPKPRSAYSVLQGQFGEAHEAAKGSTACFCSKSTPEP